MTLSRVAVDAGELVSRFPPRMEHVNKRTIYARACPPGAVHRGRLIVSRHVELALPERYGGASARLEVRPDVFAYTSPDEWHVNFAHHDLFCMYGGPLLAQDELQVAEHPVLASLREAMIAGAIKVSPLTVERGRPTPILIRGAERRVAIDTAALYGHNFRRASVEAVEAATVVIDPPTITNLIAMEAPYGGRTLYRSFELEYILTTAYTAFRAAGGVVHTGFWGCGAYGGDRVLMTMLQILAAHLAGLDRLVFHTVTRAGVGDYEEGASRVAALEPAPLSKVLADIHRIGFVWGVGNGT